jgi:hypothetical protein
MNTVEDEAALAEDEAALIEDEAALIAALLLRLLLPLLLPLLLLLLLLLLPLLLPLLLLPSFAPPFIARRKRCSAQSHPAHWTLTSEMIVPRTTEMVGAAGVDIVLVRAATSAARVVLRPVLPSVPLAEEATLAELHL